MEGAKEMARAIKQTYITMDNVYEAQVACDNAQTEALAIAKQWQPPANVCTPAKHAALEKLEQTVAALDRAQKVAGVTFALGMIVSAPDRTAEEDAMCGTWTPTTIAQAIDASWAKISQADTDFKMAREGAFRAVGNEFTAARKEMAATAKRMAPFSRNVRACQGKGVQLYKNLPK